MDYKKLNETAMANARKILVERYDPVAFIVYSTARNNLHGIEMEDTEIDDSIKDVFFAFALYHKNCLNNQKNPEDFDLLLKEIHRMLSELYYQSNSKEKQKLKTLAEKIVKL